MSDALAPASARHPIVTPIASPNHLSCWRSTFPADRYRETTDQMRSGSRITAIAETRSETLSPSHGRRSNPTPNGLSTVGKTWRGPGRIRKTVRNINGVRATATFSARSHAGVWPRPVGNTNPRAKTAPPRLVNRTVNHPAIRHVEPADRRHRRMGSKREGHSRPEHADRVPVADDHHQPADDVARPADPEDRAHRSERDPEDTEPNDRSLPESERAWKLRDGVDDAQRDGADGTCDRSHPAEDRKRTGEPANHRAPLRPGVCPSRIRAYAIIGRTPVLGARRSPSTVARRDSSP